MSLTTGMTLLGLAAALGAAWALGGTLGTGALAGFLAGASASGLAVAIQRRAAARRPALLLHAVLGGFLLKACALLALTLAVRYVDALAAVADARTFLLGFAGAALLVLAPATLDTLRMVDPARGAAPRRVEEARAP